MHSTQLMLLCSAKYIEYAGLLVVGVMELITSNCYHDNNDEEHTLCCGLNTTE